MIAAADTARRESPVRFRLLDIGEPISVRLACFDSDADLRICLKELRSARTPGLTVVVQLPRGLDGPALPALLDLATGRASRVVLIPAPANGAAFEKILASAVQQKWPCPVEIESAAKQAVVGAMQSLRAGDTLALLWPDEPALADPVRLAALGARWRAAWEAPEDGEFHWLPPADGVP